MGSFMTHMVNVISKLQSVGGVSSFFLVLWNRRRWFTEDMGHTKKNNQKKNSES